MIRGTGPILARAIGNYNQHIENNINYINRRDWVQKALNK